jgi:hypothetical protein
LKQFLFELVTGGFPMKTTIVHKMLMKLWVKPVLEGVDGNLHFTVPSNIIDKIINGSFIGICNVSNLVNFDINIFILLGASYQF